MDYVVAVEGLDSIDLREVPDQIRRFASIAVNATARKFRTESSRRIREQIAFPAQYLDSKSTGNLKVVKNATADAMEAVIQGRFRATSMTRFIKGSKAAGRKGVTVEVAKGQRQKMNRAFIMNLRSGNVGLAIRLKEGERIENKTRMVRMNSGLYLLYGPSVDQVFRSVAEDVKDDAGDYLEQEFIRLSEALT